MDTQDRAVDTLCGVIETASRPMWIIDASSGIDPERLGHAKSGDVIVARHDTRVEAVEPFFDADIFHIAVDAVACYVRWSCKE